MDSAKVGVAFTAAAYVGEPSDGFDHAVLSNGRNPAAVAGLEVFAQPENDEIEVGGPGPLSLGGGPLGLCYAPHQSAVVLAQLRGACGNVRQREKRQAKPFVALLNGHADRALYQRAPDDREIG